MVWFWSAIIGLVANEGTELKRVSVLIHKILSWIYIGIFALSFLVGLACW